MNQSIKKLVFKLYKLINYIPFNNKRKGKIKIQNDGAILLHCKIKSSGTDNSLILHGGGYTLIARLVFLAVIIQSNLVKIVLQKTPCFIQKAIIIRL